MTIRKLEQKDLEHLARLFIFIVKHLRKEEIESTLTENIPDNEELARNLDYLVNTPEKAVFVAVENQKIIGFIAGEIREKTLPSGKLKKTGFITATYIEENFRGMGILKQLDMHLTGFFKVNNVSSVEISILSKNIAAKKSWEKLGYTTFREDLNKEI